MKKTLASILVLVLLFMPVACDNVRAKSLLKVAFLDIGQGDSIYIQAPNGNQMIIDGGPGSALLPALGDVLPFGDRSINVLVVTNPDADHYSGFIDLLKNYDVGAVIESGTHTGTPTHAKLQTEIAEKNIPEILARRGMKIELDEEDGVVFEVLFPDRNVSSWTSNDGSIEGILVYGKTKIMFTGDGTQKTESIILSENTPEILKSDILKVGHHGSRTSTSGGFVRAIAPAYAVISDGKNNKYGHPHKETLDTLGEYGVHILRTDQKGTIVFTSDGNSFTEND